jgi:hypothetical protein
MVKETKKTISIKLDLVETFIALRRSLNERSQLDGPVTLNQAIHRLVPFRRIETNSVSDLDFDQQYRSQ